MTASVRRRTSSGRALLALAGVALLALLALAVLLLGSAVTESGRTSGAAAHGAAVTAVGEPGSTAPAVHALHQQPSTRARSVAFGVLAAAVVVGAWASARLRLARSGRLRRLRITGLPSGRAPPTVRIA
jgi:hypothetical protein